VFKTTSNDVNQNEMFLPSSLDVKRGSSKSPDEALNEKKITPEAEVIQAIPSLDTNNYGGDKEIVFFEKSVANLLNKKDMSPIDKPRAPISLLYPCGARDVTRIYQVLQSVSQQTVFPNETIFVFSFKEDTSQQFVWKYLKQYNIPNLKFYFRGGFKSVGNNRQFLSTVANSEILSYCDCDDYIHPQRIEVLSRLFAKFPDIEHMIHTFQAVHRDKNDVFDPSKVTLRTFTEDEIESWKLPFNFSDVWNHSTMIPFSDIPWVAGDPNTEPDHPNSKFDLWWFPKGFKEYSWHNQPHNAWYTVRAKTAREITFPVIDQEYSSEDSLMNWRMIRNHRNWTCLDMPLGAYVRPYNGP